MLQTIAIRGYRSLREVILPLTDLTVVTGANGTGKSSIYRALRLLADCGRGQVIGSLAREGGLQSVLWAGPEQPNEQTQGTVRTRPVSLELGFAADDFGYLVDLGLPQMAGSGGEPSAFAQDPEIKREVVFAGPVLRPASTLVSRTREYAEVAAQSGRGFDELTRSLPSYRSVLAEYAHPDALPELSAVSDRLRDWRFYDGFRVDAGAPARQPHVGTRTPVLSDDGSDLAAAVQTIVETTFDDLARAVADAFDGATVSVAVNDGLFDLQLRQRGMLRPLRAAELSDGTLRFLLWATALAEPAATVADGAQRARDVVAPPTWSGRWPPSSRPPPNSPRVVVVTHSRALLDFLDTTPAADEERSTAIEVELYKQWGETKVEGFGMLNTPSWHWGKR